MLNKAEAVYNDFKKIMKANLGRVPHTRLPRISRMKSCSTRSTLTDVSGNAIIFVSYGKEDQDNWEKADDKNQSPLQKSIATSVRFRDYKEDEKAAAATLDVDLKKPIMKIKSRLQKHLLSELT